MSDPKIRYDIEAGVTGGEDVNKLAGELQTLSTSLDPSIANVAASLANQLRSLGRQQEAVQTFVDLKRGTLAAREELERAQTAAQSLAREIAASGAPTKAQTGQLEKLKDEVNAAKGKFNEFQVQIAAQRQTLANAGIDTQNLAREQQILRQRTDEAVSSGRSAVASFNAQASGAAQFDAALKTLGVRSLANTEKEVQKVEAALRTVLATSRNPLEIRAATDAAQARIRALRGEVEATQTAGGGLSEIFGKLGPALAGVFTASKFVETIVATDSLKKGLTAVFGSAEAAGKEMEYIREVSNRLGLEVTGAGQAYLRLAAATKGTAIGGEQTRKVFEAVSRAMSTLGKSSDETKNALLAVQQIASKGTVSMEELRGQLGEALPGAMQAAAQGAGITVGELTKMVESGSVLAQDLLPALTKGLDDLYAKGGPPDNLISNWNRLKNEISKVTNELGEGGVVTALSDTAIVTAKVIGNIDKGVTALGTGIGKLGGAVGSLDFKEFNQDISDAWMEMQEFDAQTGKATKAVQHLGTQAQASFRQVEIAAQNAAAQAGSLLLAKQITELTEAAKQQVEQAVKSNAARLAEASTIQTLANLFGSEAEKRQAALNAQASETTSLFKLADARFAEVIVLKQTLQLLQDNIKGQDKVSQQQQKQIDDTSKLIQIKMAEADQSIAVARAKNQELAATREAIAAIADNSARVGELKTAYESALKSVETLTRAKAAGKAVDEDLRQATIESAAAAKLYRDALGDVVKRLEERSAAQQQTATITRASLDIDLEYARTAVEVAKAKGDEQGAIEAGNRVRQIEVQIYQAQATAAYAEADATIALVKAKRAELEATGALTVEKKAELDATLRSAEAKRLEGDKAIALADRLVQVAQASEQVNRSAKTGADGLDGLGSKLDSVASKADRARASLGNLARDADGFAVDRQGNRVNAEAQTGLSIFNTLKGYGLDEATARKVTQEFLDAYGNVPSSNNPGVKKYNARSLSEALQRAAQPYVLGQKAPDGGNSNANGGNVAASPLYIVRLDQTGNPGFNVYTNTTAEAQRLVQALLNSKRVAGGGGG